MKSYRISHLFRIPRRNIGYFKLAEHQTLTKTDPQLIVSEKYGFLPREIPLFDIPPAFQKVDELLKAAPIIKEDGSPGLMALGKFAEAVANDLPLYDVSDIEDTRLLNALMRDYAFLASMYVYEPCDISFRQTGEFGLGRDHIPANIAVPLCKLAQKLNLKPFLEYSQYLAFNWTMNDPNGDWSHQNINCPRTFEGSKGELGFKVVHLYINQESGKLVKYTYDLFRACENQDRAKFDEALINMLNNNRNINLNMNTMWKESDPKKFLGFRVFVLGIKNQPMFPNGVVYQGVSEEPRFYRGPSGANDLTIPTLDNVFEVTSQMKKNSITDIINDYGTYRTTNHNEFLAWTESKAKELGTGKFACEDSNSAVLYTANLDQIAEFRERHWRFVKLYIIKNSKEAKEGEESPLFLLPNQIEIVLNLIETFGKHIDISKLSEDNLKSHTKLLRRTASMKNILEREVAEIKAKFAEKKDL